MTKEKRTNKKKDIQKLTDAKIVELVKADLEQYRHIINRYEEKLLRYIRRILYINKEDAEDILQDVFLKAYKNINSYDSKYKFSSWIYRIAHNEAVSFLRRKKREIDTVEDSEIFDTLPSNIDIEDDFLKNLKGSEVREILDKLDRKYREVLVLRYFEEMEYNEISDTLHISSGTVASLISRGKKKFKMLVQRYGKNI
jgi:RNA polymerase sigma-70 factor (ECF subfamily)